MVITRKESIPTALLNYQSTFLPHSFFRSADKAVSKSKEHLSSLCFLLLANAMFTKMIHHDQCTVLPLYSLHALCDCDTKGLKFKEVRSYRDTF